MSRSDMSRTFGVSKPNVATWTARSFSETQVMLYKQSTQPTAFVGRAT